MNVSNPMMSPFLRKRSVYRLYRMDPDDTLLVVQDADREVPVEWLYLTTLRAATPTQAVFSWLKLMQAPPDNRVFLQERRSGVWSVDILTPAQAAASSTLIAAGPDVPALPAANMEAGREQGRPTPTAGKKMTAPTDVGKPAHERRQPSPHEKTQLPAVRSQSLVPAQRLAHGMDGLLARGRSALTHGKAALARCTDLRAEDESGRTAFLRAAGKGQTLRAAALLRLGADLEARDREGRTALMLIAAEGALRTTGDDPALVKLLLARGADVDAVDSEGNTALLWAAKRARADLMQMLLIGGAQVNVCDRDGMTPLMWALRAGCLSVVPLLLGHGANVRARSRSGETALAAAVIGGTVKEIETLLRYGADANARDNVGQTALLLAAFCGNALMVRTLLAYGADAEARDNFGNTALNVAVSRGHRFLVHLLQTHRNAHAPRQWVA